MVETFYVHIKFKTKKDSWSINLPFLCSKCSKCCTLDDFLTAGEIKIKSGENLEITKKVQELYNKLSKIWEADEDQYDNYITHTACPFLQNKSCTIYEYRPGGCRQFPNTPFGFQTKDCEALNRFKKQFFALKKGRCVKVKYYFMNTQESFKIAKITAQQYQNCMIKLRKAGITMDEYSLFQVVNSQK